MEQLHISFGYQLLLVLVVLGLNGFFAAAETALISVRPSRMRELADKGDLGAQAALSLLANTERMLSVGQVGLTLASLVLGWLGEVVFVRVLTGGMQVVLPAAAVWILHGVSFTIAFLAMTYLHVVIGEVVPKNLAIEKADRMAVLFAPPLLVFYKVSLPLVWVIERSSAVMSRWLGIRESHLSASHSVEELHSILTASRTGGHLTAFQEASMRKLLDLEEYTVSEVMVPRTSIVSVADSIRIDQLSSLFNETHFSRLPVYSGQPENLIGIVHVKDVMDCLVQFRRATLRDRTAKAFDLEKLLRKAPLVPETNPINEAFETLRENRAHVAFVVDEHGSITGMISMEDIMEQIFGEIEDEYDVRAVIQARTASEIEVEGTISLVDLEAQYGISLPPEVEAETLAGFLMQELQAIPSSGESLVKGDRRYTVLAMAGNRVERVRISRESTSA